MIVLDAKVLIALLDETDPHAEAALALLTEYATEPLGASPINRAEALVGAARSGRIDVAQGVFDDLDVEDIALPDDAPERLAELRVSTRCKMPDCCALLAAQQAQAKLATFDHALVAAAIALGIPVVPVGRP